MTKQDSNSNLVKIYSDTPTNQNIKFGFDIYADTLAGLIANPENETPLVIGIYGSWGTGKTTLMNAIRDRLDGCKKGDFLEEISTPIQKARNCKTVWFQAWKYDKENEILAGLLESIFQAMAVDDFFSKAKGEIEKLAKGLNKLKILGFVSKLASGVDISDFFKELEYKKQLGFFDIFNHFFSDLIYTYLNWRIKLVPSDRPDDKRGSLVIFIDDLDRCPQSRIVMVLETIKLFMDHKCCIFVIGADRQIIVKALSREYSEQDALRFMDKIVQVAFNLPKITEDMFRSLLADMQEIHSKISQNLSLIVPSMGENPRQIKRFINDLNLRHGLLHSAGLSIAFDTVLHWGIIQHSFSQLADELVDRPKTLFNIKNQIKALSDEMEHSAVWEADDQLFKNLNVPQSLHKYIRNEAIVRIISNFEIEQQDFIKLLTFSSNVSPGEIGFDRKGRTYTPKMSGTMALGGSVNVTFTPGLAVKWADIMTEVPKGKFKFGKDGEEVNIENPLWVDIYPVTNARYKAFVDAGGYETEKWWRPTGGWEWRKENGIIQPRYWNSEKWNQDNHPVVGVSWYEAAAFCNWLTEASKTPCNYHLPSEEQWERAARGTEGLEYPWGNGFDYERCNTRESGKRMTTRVDLYADGLSQIGCYDMAGNVWEWTSDLYNEKKDSYTLKGGSWNLPASYACCAYRSLVFPGSRHNDVGFRCARTLT